MSKTHLVALKRPHTRSPRRTLSRHAPRRRKLPHLDRLVQAARDQFATAGAKGNTVDAILVSRLALEPLDQEARRRVPNAHALVEGAGGDVAAVGRQRDGGDAVFDRQLQRLAARLEIPEAHAAVAGARGDDLAVARKVERVYVLLVALELVADGAGVDVPDLRGGGAGQHVLGRRESEVEE